MKKVLLILTAFLSFCSCDKYDLGGMFCAHGPDVNKRFANSMIYNESSPVPDIVLGTNEYEVYLITDIHYIDGDAVVSKFVSICLQDTTAENFVISLGDNVGDKNSYASLQTSLKPLYDAGWTVFSTPGNHDFNFGMYSQYQQIWPRTTYQFKVLTPSAGTDLFIALDSADGKLGTDQRNWLENTLSTAHGENYRNIYVLTHTHFFKKDNSQFPTGNFALEETVYLTALFARYGVNYVLTGHDHHYEYTKYRNVDYYVLSAASNKQGSCYRATFGETLKLEEVLICP